jgi:outer membrane protein assembly factor BamA
MGTYLFRILFICFTACYVFGQNEEDSTETKDFGIFGYPYAFYSPETDLAFGVGGMVYFRTTKDPDIELSNVVLSGYYTINNQYTINLTPELYLSKSGDYFKGDFFYGKFLDKFYGYGSQSPEIPNPDYLTNDFNAYFYFQKNITKNIEVGVIYDYFNSTISDKKENELLLNDEVVGTDGGVSSGLGFSAAWDSRDYVYVSTRGWYYYFSSVFYSKAFGSTYDFNEYTLDLREFYHFIQDHVLAFQGYAKIARGNPPFYEVPRLGGGVTMRGYFEGRYRDEIYLTMQMEYKTMLFWKIGGVLFGGLGDVAREFNNFKMTNLKYSYGFGLRYAFDLEERLTIRADFGFGKNTSGVYFSMQEAF